MRPLPPPALATAEATPGGGATYADLLSAYETRRRAADDILLRKLANPLHGVRVARLS